MIPQRGVVLIAIHHGLKSQVQAEGVRPIDSRSALLGVLSGVGFEIPDAARFRVLHSFGMDGPSEAARRVMLATEQLEARPDSGVILEAVLRGAMTPSRLVFHRLDLSLLAFGQDTLEIGLPDRATVERAVVGGQDVIPVSRNSVLRLPLPAARRSREPLSARLEYRVPETDGDQPTWPRLTWPCLATSWLVTAPPYEVIRSRSPGLITQEFMSNPGEWLWTGWRSSRIAGADIPLDPQSIAEWNRAGTLLPRGSRTLGTLLTRWDAGPRPLVIDRLALRDVGLGPETPLQTGISSAGASPTTVWDMFRGLGLTLRPQGECLLVTTALDHTSSRGAGGARNKRAAVRAAAGWGSDPTTRFQAVTHWNNSPVPEAGTEVAGSRVVTSHGFARIGYPGNGDQLERRDLRAWWAVRAVIVVAVLAGGLAIRRWRRAGRVHYLAVVAAGAVLLVRWNPDLMICCGLGLLACLGFWVGPALRRRPPRPGRDRLRRSSRMATASLPVGLLLLTPFTFNLMGGEEPKSNPDARDEDVILAVSTTDEPTIVVITRADADRLRAWADLGMAAHAESLVTAADIEHRIDAREGSTVVVESRLVLVLDGDESAAWDLPLGASREITGELDGKPAMLEVPPNDWVARVWVREPGRHLLTVRRQVDLLARDGGLELDLPVNSVATARVSCVSHDDHTEFIGVRGSSQPDSDGGISAELGPVERLRVHWSPKTDAEKTPPRITAEGLLLWDASPAGDRVHARLTYRVAGSVSEIRVGLGPGAVVRSAKVPGLTAARLQNAPDGTTWIAHVDPPWSGVNSFQLDVWQPDQRSGGPRSVPRVEPLGVEISNWVLGFRRPGSWVGRLGSVKGAEILADELFARAWGTFPDPPATFAGAVRSPHFLQVEITTGPTIARATAQPHVVVKVEPGRLLVTSEAEITEREGRVRELAVRIPNAWRVIRVQADSLTSWSRPEAGEIRLRFDGVGTAPRRARIEGWLPIHGEPLQTPGVVTEPLPWPTWSGLEAGTGELRLLAPRALGVRLADVASGVTSISSQSTGQTDPTLTDLSYQVKGFVTSPGNLVWTGLASFTKVSVGKLLTIYPTAAVLSALLDYQIQGGPLHAVTFSLPLAWGRQAHITCDGIHYALQSDERESTVSWTLRPEQPVWGTLRIRIEAERTFDPSGELSAPEIVPRGRGEITSFLALANATGHPLITEGEGVAAVGATSARVESLPIFQGIPCTTYRMTREDWRLSVRQPTSSSASSATAGILLADHTGVIAADGSSWGLVRFDLGSALGPLLSVRFPAEADVLGALVDGRPTRMFRDPADVWYLPVPDGTPSRAELIWKSRVGPPRTGGEFRLPLPSVSPSGVPTQVTIFAPEGGTIQGRGMQFVSATAADLELDRVGTIARNLTDRANQLDRGSASERSQLLEALIQFDLACRTLDRSTRFASPAGASGRASLERLRAIRDRLEESLRVGGLDTYLEAARFRVGVTTDLAHPAPIEEPVTPIRLSLPQLGVPRMFRAVDLTEHDAPVFLWSPDRADVRTTTALAVFESIGLASLLLGAGLFLARFANRVRLDHARIGAVGLALLGLLFLPVAGVIFTASLALGWFARPRTIVIQS